LVVVGPRPPNSYPILGITFNLPHGGMREAWEEVATRETPHWLVVARCGEQLTADPGAFSKGWAVFSALGTSGRLLEMPPELCDHIVDWLHGQPHTPKTPLSRAPLSRYRKHIFSTTSFSGNPDVAV